MKKMNKILAALAFGAIFLGSCDKEDQMGTVDFVEYEPKGNIKYVITATPIGTTGIADYLLTADNLSGGMISTRGNGIEQDGSYRYYMTHKGRFFSLLYGQGNPGDVTTYRMQPNGELVKTKYFQTETVQAFTKINDELLLIKIPRSGQPNAMFFRIDALQSRMIDQKPVNIVDLAANGERAHFTWATQVGNKVFAPYMSIKGCCGDAFGTAYPDSSWVAVFSYPALELEKVIRDNRTSFIGNYFNNGLAVVENGDVYGFSPASAKLNSQLTTTRPSAMVRILKGTTEFDKSYFFNVEEKSGGHHISTQTYLGNNKFLLTMYGTPKSTSGYLRLALVDVVSQQFTWLKGAPEEINSVSAAYNNNTGTEDGKIGYVGVNTTSGSQVYKIDIQSGVASPGLKVDGGTITAITKMEY
ncbi:DUF4374 domain-containing protein [Chitinophaga solisilvae]|uniref:DUF4374 domain-containing protein n=1 Tax=Chitinophaga solisilvae TaxID=1233460 RepID=UPI00136BA901|nr:DUF4374 domain-containing protein [Chitinophaga solisilvae]